MLPELGVHRHYVGFLADGLADGLARSTICRDLLANRSDRRVLTHMHSWLTGSGTNRWFGYRLCLVGGREAFVALNSVLST